jgi:transcriptional regulator with XRE-family HTH domain
VAATEPTVAELVHQYRVERNWSRERLARDMHKSISWLAQVERGELVLTDVTVLDRFATLLGAPLAEFIEAALGPSTERPRQRPHVEQLRLALAGHPVPDTITTTASTRTRWDLKTLQQRRDHAWQLLHASAYRDLGSTLAALLADLEIASRSCPPAQRTQVHTLLAESYQAAAAMLVKVGDRGAGWVAADRAIAAGERSHSPALILAGQLRMARTLLDSSEQDLARHVLIQATRRRDAIIANGDLGLISLAGSSALLLAVLLARNADARGADHSINIARELATALGGDHNYHGTEFGPTNVVMHAVAVAVELGNGQQALDRATHIRSTAHMSTERQARYLVDLARAHILTRSPTQALQALIKAEHIAPEELAETPLVAAVIEDIEAQTKHARQPALRRLKQRLYA